MNNFKIYRLVLLLPLILFTNCSDDGSDPVSIEGTWRLQNQELSVLVNGIPISTELLEQLEFDASDIEIPEGSTIELAAGGQLTVNSPGETSVNGTWSLSTNGKTLTLIQDGEAFVFEVLELTATNLNIKTSQTEQIEQNGIPVNVTGELTLYSTRQ